MPVTRPTDSSPALYYKWSIVNIRLSGTVMEIWHLTHVDTERKKEEGKRKGKKKGKGKEKKEG